MKLLVFYAFFLGSIFLAFYIEARIHQRNLRQLPLRIHVNGTRGKSSVTRLIAAGLRAGGHQVVAKTTGTEPRLILPDGHEERIQRRGPANIRENIRLIRCAVRQKADTIVFECMALQPELQNFCEHRLIQSHIGVITNVRADHEDVMGKGLLQVAAALGNTIPEHGILITTPEAYALIRQTYPEAVVQLASGSSIDAELLKGFPYAVIPDNLALALMVCSIAGVDAHAAVQGMRQAEQDAGNLRIVNFMVGDISMRLINALAANDPESTCWLWSQYVSNADQTIVFLNCRKDRRFRTVQLCQSLQSVGAVCFMVAGDVTFAVRSLRQAGCPEERIVSFSVEDGFDVFLCRVAELSEHQVTVFAAGNIKGLPSDFLSRFNGG